MTPIANHLDGAGNIVDRASSAADRLLDATRQAADSTFGNVVDKVHALRTHAAPLQSLLLAAALGVTLMAVVGVLRSSRRR